MNPAVSFVVPCYRLAHLLGDCISSMLRQTYTDFEILVMDDCSPDDTGQVVRSFDDPRIRYVRNDTNLGHVPNFNKGIGLCRGRYVCLISADDYLRQPYLVERYVAALDASPNVGFAFCPGVGVLDSVETGPLAWCSVHGPDDRIVPGRQLVASLLERNTILAPSVMVRSTCYEQLGDFPLDMPWMGDWYLWCLFAFHFDVAYFAEPMVCYRQHALNITKTLTERNAVNCVAEELRLPWLVKRMADRAGDTRLSRACLDAAVALYVRFMTTDPFDVPAARMSRERLERHVLQATGDDALARRVRARVFAGVADRHFWLGSSEIAREFYAASCRENRWMPSVHAKRLLLALGDGGRDVRKTVGPWLRRKSAAASQIN
jgi:hypothetical protein